MKTLRNIIIVIIFGALVAFCLYIAPNYANNEYENITNLVINYTNVTGKTKGEIIMQDDGTIYLSKEDIQNYYDEYIYYDEQYNYIITTSNENYACFNIEKETVSINGTVTNSKIMQKDGTYYIPITDIEEVYNININYVSESDTIIIESLDKKLETAKTTKNVNVKNKNTIFSKTIEKLDENAKISIVPNDENVDYKGWTKIRTENGKIGYIKTEYLTDFEIEREETNEESLETISLVWEYFSEYSTAPVNDETVKYDGVNVVSPSFFYMEQAQVIENVGVNGVSYINWAKNNNYEVWAMVANNNDSTDKMDEFSSWINDYQKRQAVINQIVNYAETYNLDGINIDFENIYKSDKDALSRFIIELKPRLESIDVILSVDVTAPDGADNWSLCYDRNVIGDVADYIVFMAYDQYGESSTQAGSTAAYNWIETNINKFLNYEEVDSNKIILGVPLYTRLWKEENGNITSTVVSMKNVNNYITEESNVEWLQEAQQNYLEYTQDGITYRMWIEDSDSITQKLNLIENYNLAGAAFWRKGFEDESIWSLVSDKLLE